MTSSTRTDNNNPNYVNSKGEQRGMTPLNNNSSDNMIKGLDYNFNYWNPAIPPTSTTPVTPHAPVGGYPQQQQQQQQQQSHTPALSTSSTLYNASSSPEAQNNTRAPATNPSYSTSNNSNTNTTNTGNNTAYTWHTTNPNSSYATNDSSNNNNNTPYNWHATNPYPQYQPGPDYNRRLTPLEEEESRTTSHVGVPSWTSEFESEVGLGRNPSTLHRNASTRRESPTLGTGAAWNSRSRGPVANRNTQETDLMDRERDFEYDIPRTAGKSYFARLQALSGLSGYTIGNPFTSRI